MRCEADCFSGEDGFCCEAGGSWAVLYVQVVPLPPGLVCGRVLVLSIHFDRRPPLLLGRGFCGRRCGQVLLTWTGGICGDVCLLTAWGTTDGNGSPLNR